MKNYAVILSFKITFIISFVDTPFFMGLDSNYCLENPPGA